MPDDAAILHARGAPMAVLDAIAAAGLPLEVVRSAIERSGGWFGRFRAFCNPSAALSASELAALEAIAALAVKVADAEGGPEGAARFWSAEMPWLEGRSPAYWLAWGDISVIEELRERINYGLPP
jgi:hypothetical protein